MLIKGVVFNDFINYKEPTMVILTSRCNGFKCEKENGTACCHNKSLASAPSIHIDNKKLVEKYLSNYISKALCFSGLEPFDQWQDVRDIIQILRNDYRCNDTVIIYTGYTEEELEPYTTYFSEFGNIIVKYGRFLIGQTPHYDKLLGVKLASDNQYAKGYGINVKNQN